MIHKDLALMETKMRMLERSLSPRELENPVVSQKLRSIRECLLKLLKTPIKGNL